MSSQITKPPTDTLATLRSYLVAQKDALAQVVPKHLTVERLMRVSLNCVSKNPDLAKCSVSSIMRCIQTAAELGLEPGGGLGHAAMIPYNGEATFQVMYRGWAHLMRQSGNIASIEAVIVNAKDVFHHQRGDDPKIIHEPFEDGDPGPMVKVYCIITERDGTKHREVMSKAAVDKIRAISRAKDGNMWVNHYDEAAKKTVFKRLVKWQALTTEEQRKAAELDDDDYVDADAMPMAPAVTDEPTATQKAAASVKRRLAIQDSTAAEVVDPAIEAQEAAISAEVAAKEAAKAKQS